MNRWTRHFGPFALVGLVCLVMFMQFFQRSLLGRTLLAAPEEERAVELSEPPGLGPVTLAAKLMVREKYLQLGTEDAPKHDGGEEVQKELDELSREAITRPERLRLGILTAEMVGAQASLDTFRGLAAEATPEGEFARDAKALLNFYEAHALADAALSGEAKPEAAPVRPVLDGQVYDGLRARHSWFATLAATYGKGGYDPQRDWLVRGSHSLIGFFLLRGVLYLGFFVLGVIFLIMTIKKAREEGFVPEFYTTSIPGEVYLETVIVFFLSFAMMLGVSVVLLGQSDAWAVMVSEVLQWSLVLSFLWPMMRGVTFGELALDLGLESGQGVGAEIMIGIAGFMVTRPIESVVGIAAAALEEALFGVAKDPGGVAMFRQPLTESWWPFIFGALGAVVWAPFIEECIFRGALHRWLPAKLGPVLRVLISSALFGAAHPYGLAGMLSVAAGGVVFGALREWRGSLIAPMTAHFLNNATIVGSQLALLKIIE
ncbi:MAG: CPBP family intramembrane glutamic endopeptidase [Phycisphaerales bacterium]|jgi:membrane protease YdiL (CAAX protease family)